jgi:hypothetical protein
MGVSTDVELTHGRVIARFLQFERRWIHLPDSGFLQNILTGMRFAWRGRIIILAVDLMPCGGWVELVICGRFVFYIGKCKVTRLERMLRNLLLLLLLLYGRENVPGTSNKQNNKSEITYFPKAYIRKTKRIQKYLLQPAKKEDISRYSI